MATPARLVVLGPPRRRRHDETALRSLEIRDIAPSSFLRVPAPFGGRSQRRRVLEGSGGGITGDRVDPAVRRFSPTDSDRGATGDLLAGAAPRSSRGRCRPRDGRGPKAPACHRETTNLYVGGDS